jgi:CheY-like chemotaxis protein
MARILIIEDNPTNRQLMAYLLRAFGHTVAEASDGETGLTQAAEAPDLILCDIHLPGIDGYQVAAHLKSSPELRVVPLVAVTALAMVGDRDRVMDAGFNGYLTKPIEPETFVQQVEGFLARSHP